MKTPLRDRRIYHSISRPSVIRLDASKCGTSSVRPYDADRNACPALRRTPLLRGGASLYALLAKVFIAFGGKETDNPAVNDRMVGLVHLVEANFRAAGYDDSNIRVVIEPDALHSEPARASRLSGALQFLFGEWRETALPGN